MLGGLAWFLCIIRPPFHHFAFDGFHPFECKRRKGQGRQVTQLPPANFNSAFCRQSRLPHLFNLQAYSHMRLRRLWSSARVPTTPPLAAKLSSLLLCRQVSLSAVRAVFQYHLFPPVRSFFLAESSFCDNEVHSTKCPFTLLRIFFSPPDPPYIATNLLARLANITTMYLLLLLDAFLQVQCGFFCAIVPVSAVHALCQLLVPHVLYDVPPLLPCATAPPLFRH